RNTYQNQEEGSEPTLTSESELILTSEALKLQRLYSFRVWKHQRLKTFQRLNTFIAWITNQTNTPP
ncbi:hypothetical protein A2U01_0119173, partial [Trifolium medium]|nr:hypothetical protein [Trifolium medium]